MKKMNLFTVVCLCIGTIIGAGIFGSMPSAALLAGPALVAVCAVAAVEILIRYLPSMVPATAIPANNGFYMYLTRLVHPYVGFLQMLQVLFNVFVLALLAEVFAQYFSMIAETPNRAVALLVIFLFGLIALMGVSASAMVNNAMVLILMVALGSFVICGLPEIKPELFNLRAAFSLEEMSFTSFGAALGLISSCMMGGYVSIYYAEDMKNPKKNVLRAFILSTLLVAIAYAFIGAVTVGVVPMDEATSLASLAELFMPGPLYWFFVVGGALFALATTIIGCILGGMVNLSVIARDRVLPDIFMRKNRHDVSPACLILVCASAMFIVAFDLPISTLMSVSSVLGIIIAVAQFIPALRLSRKYPHCCQHASVKFSRPVLWVLIVIASLFCIYEAYSLIMTSAGAVWWALLIVLALSYAYFFARIAYLKKRGVDLLSLMSAPYAPWEEKEAEYAALDGGQCG